MKIIKLKDNRMIIYPDYIIYESGSILIIKVTSGIYIYEKIRISTTDVNTKCFKCSFYSNANGCGMYVKLNSFTCHHICNIHDNIHNAKNIVFKFMDSISSSHFSLIYKSYLFNLCQKY